jgi:hypothetical protein
MLAPSQERTKERALGWKRNCDMAGSTTECQEEAPRLDFSHIRFSSSYKAAEERDPATSVFTAGNWH